MKKEKLILIVIMIISGIILTWNKSYSYEINNNEVEEKEIERKEFAIYLETEQNSSKTDNDYSTAGTYPSQGYLLNEEKTKCYEYGSNSLVPNAVEQSLSNGVIDGSIIVTSQKSIYCNIYFDKEEDKPEVNTFTLTGSENGTTLSDPSKYTHTTNVTYNVTWSNDDVAQVCVSEGTGCNEWKEITDKEKKSYNETITLTDSKEGEKTIYVYLKDKAGNVSAGKSNTIKLDTIDPTISLTKNTQTETSITVKVTVSDANGIKGVECKTTSPTAETGTYSGSAGTCTFSGLTAGTEYSITATATDNSGRAERSQIKISTEKKKLTGSDLIKEENRPLGLSTKILGESPKNSSTYNDDMYRFVGECNALNGGCDNKVRNFICFGTTNKEDCTLTSDYMYRIIGITRDGRIKLIKNAALKETGFSVFHWASFDWNILWPQSDLYRRLNGTSGGTNKGRAGDTNLFIDAYSTSSVQYIKTSGDTSWYDKVEKHSWLHGRLGTSFLSETQDLNDIYNIETGQSDGLRNSETVEAKIGLMNFSDFIYASSQKGNCYDGVDCGGSWMHMSNNGVDDQPDSEWTMIPTGSGSNSWWVWYVDSDGFSWNNQQVDRGIRPVFYLLSSVEISDGDGSSTNPFIVAK